MHKYDPYINQRNVAHEYDITTVSEPINRKYDAIVIAVAHDKFKSLTAEQIREFGKKNHVLYDTKYLLEAGQVDGRL